LAEHIVTLLPEEKQVGVPTGTLVSDAILKAGMDLDQPCGAQGRCGRCAIIIEQGEARRRSTIRLSLEDIEEGYALACQTVIEADLTISLPEQEIIARRLITDKAARQIELPFEVTVEHQPIRAFQLNLQPPSLDDSTADLERLQKSLAAEGILDPRISLVLLRKLATGLRRADWSPWLVMDHSGKEARLLDLVPDRVQPYGLALDIGTTTVTAFLVDLSDGSVRASAAEYNAQIKRGEDVISRIIYAEKSDGLDELGLLVRETIDALLERLRRRTGISPMQIYKATVVGNTTMIHLFLGLPPEHIRLSPFAPLANRPFTLTAGEASLNIHPEAPVDCLPGVASYMGADISAGVLSAGLTSTDQLTLFIDIGTNGEIVLGNEQWLVSCACSAGPAFEGAGVLHGMRATKGAIEEVWIHSETHEPTIRVIGGSKPKGICGSGLISLLAELFVTGVVDRSGNFKPDEGSARVRNGKHGPEFVLVWAEDSALDDELVLTKVDVDNLLRAKAAIYAGFSVLADRVGVNLADVSQVLIGGAFGKYINVENAIKIGLLPDLDWNRFHFLGNTAVHGALLSLLSDECRAHVDEIASKMTYVELSADNSFYDAFTAALFLPHTEIARFPSIAEIWKRENGLAR
jgi:uncharacterized 2Fe-2S/4Fe-4S cluster protein (DUF4445 family)